MKHYCIVYNNFRKNIEDLESGKYICKRNTFDIYPWMFDRVKEVDLIKPDQVCSSIEQQYENIYVWDCETYWEDGVAHPFACAM